jgi:hypothetical protein
VLLSFANRFVPHFIQCKNKLLSLLPFSNNIENQKNILCINNNNRESHVLLYFHFPKTNKKPTKTKTALTTESATGCIMSYPHVNLNVRDLSIAKATLVVLGSIQILWRLDQKS